MIFLKLLESLNIQMIMHGGKSLVVDQKDVVLQLLVLVGQHRGDGEAGAVQVAQRNHHGLPVMWIKFFIEHTTRPPSNHSVSPTTNHRWSPHTDTTLTYTWFPL